MDDLDSEWQRKGATLSDKTARKEFGLTQDEIVQAIRAGKLQCRLNSIYGNPFLRLLRREVEALVTLAKGPVHIPDVHAPCGSRSRARQERAERGQAAGPGYPREPHGCKSNSFSFH